MSQPGDILYLQPSPESYGSLTITKEIQLTGAGHTGIGIMSKVESIYLNANSSGSRIRGLGIGSISTEDEDNAPYISNIGIYNCKIVSITLGTSRINGYSDGGVPLYPTAVANVILKGNIITGTFDQRRRTKNILLENNIILISSTNRYLSSEKSNELIVNRNIFVTSAFSEGTGIIRNTNNAFGSLHISNSIFIADNRRFESNPNANVLGIGGNVSLSHCMTKVYDVSNSANPSSFNIDASEGTLTKNNMLENTDPLFTNINTTSQSQQNFGYFVLFGFHSLYQGGNNIDDLSLQTASPAIGAGSDGQDLGAFSNYPFEMRGYPQGLPSVVVDDYTNSVPKNGNISVTISAEAH